MLIKREKKLLPCKLTEDELLIAGDDMSKLVKKIEQEEALQKEQRAAMKERLDGLNHDLSKLATKVNNKYEDREVDVESKLDGAGMVSEIRLDTLEVLQIRPATEKEIQAKLIPESEV